VAVYLNRTVFGRTRRIVLNSAIKTFNGVIGLTESDPQLNRVAHEDEVKAIKHNFDEGILYFTYLFNIECLMSIKALFG